jgi:CheY-like chemotaxis protein
MPCTTAARILVAGRTSPSTSFILNQFEREGCAVQSVDTIAEAESSLRAARFDVVLAGEFLRDGCGYELTDSVVNHSATLLVAIALSETCLWLPVVQHGVRTLGDRALNSHSLHSEMMELLNKKLVPAEHPVASARHDFVPASHRSMAGIDQRTGPEERRGLVFKTAPEEENLLPLRADNHARSRAADGSSPVKRVTRKSLAAPRDAMPQRNVR